MPGALSNPTEVTMFLDDQGGGETHTCEECGEVLPTEQELDEHRRDRHGAGDGAPASRSAAGSGN